MADKKTKIQIILDAIDGISKPLRDINKNISKTIAPVKKLQAAMKSLAKESGIEKVEAAFKGIGASAMSAASSLWGIGKTVGLFAVGAVAALGYLIKSTLDYTMTLDSAAKKTSFSVTALQDLSFVASTAGIDFEALSKGLALFSKSMGLAHARTGPLYALMSRTDPVLLRQIISAKSNAQAFDILRHAVQRLHNENAKAAYATAALGRGGTALLPILKLSEERYQSLTKEIRKFDLTQKEVAAGKEASDTIRESTFILEQFKNMLVVQLAPSISRLFKRFNTFLGENVGKIRAWAEAFADKLPERIERLADVLETLGNIIMDVGAAFEFIKKYPDILAPAFGILAAVIGLKLVSAIRALIITFRLLSLAMLGTPIGWILILVGLLAVAAYELYLHWDMVVGVWREAVKIMEKMIFFAGKWTGLNWVFGMKGGAEGASYSMGGEALKSPPSQGINRSAPGATNKSEVTVRFANAPKGTKLASTMSDADDSLQVLGLGAWGQ